MTVAERELPMVEEGLLDAEGVEALLADIQACTTLLEVQVKGGPTAMAGTADLEQARQALRGGQVRGVQLRYRYEGAAWCDTLLAPPGPGAGGWRVVRMRADEPG